MLQFLRLRLSTKCYLKEQSFSISHHDSQALFRDGDGGDGLKKKYGAKKSCIDAQLKLENTEEYTSLALDTPTKSIPDTTRRHCRQLEDIGFHTVRKLLHHFPRTYAEPHNSPGEIYDGAYHILTGTVSTCKAVRCGSSFSLLHVIVICESLDENGIKKAIHLHLNKFFRGVRFTSQPFLRSLQSKYELGSHLFVSGKVKKMHRDDHYEMREYNIGILEKSGQNVQIDKRPYPIYPSKAGLRPNFFNDIISRALKNLSRNIDPIPIDILEEFNLPILFDAYMGIHLPGNLSEAELARRRLNFDEFFYTQDTWRKKEYCTRQHTRN